MTSLQEKILEISQCFPEGEVLTSGRFLDLGSRAAVSRCLSLLVQRGPLLRVSRGLYVAPIPTTRFPPNGFRPPAPNKIVKSLAVVTNEIIVRHGAYSANALSLTTQVPLREIFVTNGRARTLQIGTYPIEIRCAPAWLFLLGGTLAGDAVRALDWLGEGSAKKAVAKLHAVLPENEWLALESAQGTMPRWMADAICARSNKA